MSILRSLLSNTGWASSAAQYSSRHRYPLLLCVQDDRTLARALAKAVRCSSSCARRNASSSRWAVMNESVTTPVVRLSTVKKLTITYRTNATDTDAGGYTSDSTAAMSSQPESVMTKNSVCIDLHMEPNHKFTSSALASHMAAFCPTNTVSRIASTKFRMRTTALIQAMAENALTKALASTRRARQTRSSLATRRTRNIRRKDMASSIAGDGSGPQTSGSTASSRPCATTAASSTLHGLQKKARRWSHIRSSSSTVKKATNAYSHTL
mmetsp:Transcript_37255/g.97153  ORF Transcript_37255/g.97153 Transcript_37255/m.97153 type:complete len:267 (-) Transcript_37255:502-1302(-)